MTRRTPGRTAGFDNRRLTRSPFAFPGDTPGSERNKLLRHAGNPRDAVRNGLTLPWSSGVVEGTVNRIKMIKRQMYGRAGFPLLPNRAPLPTLRASFPPRN